MSVVAFFITTLITYVNYQTAWGGTHSLRSSGNSSRHEAPTGATERSPRQALMNKTTVEAAAAFSSSRGQGCVRPLLSSTTRWDGAIASCLPLQIDSNPCAVSHAEFKGEQSENDEGSDERGSEVHNSSTGGSRPSVVGLHPATKGYYNEKQAHLCSVPRCPSLLQQPAQK